MADEEYKSNSYKSKQISSTPKIKKDGLAKKALSLIVSDDIPDLKKFVFEQVVRPGVRRFILDSINAVASGRGLDISRYIPGASSGEPKVSYRSYSDNSTSSIVARSTNWWNTNEEIVYNSYADAQIVLEILEDKLERYHRVRVADLYEASNLPAPSYTANDFGWTDLRDASIETVSGGYVIRFPRAVPLR